MRLPYRKNCYVPKKKLTGYLLNFRHSKGKDKAAFFKLFGYSSKNYELLRKELICLANICPIKEIFHTEFGGKYVIEGEIKTPIKRKVTLKTIWIIRKGSKHPKLISAYPAKLFTKLV